MQCSLVPGQQAVTRMQQSFSRCSCPARQLLQRRIASSVRTQATAGAVVDAEVVERGPGVKSRIQGVLESQDRPVNADDLWDLCKDQGLRSKTFMKVMLNQMRHEKRVLAKPGPRGKAYGYILPSNYTALKEKVSKQIVGTVDDLPGNQLT